MLYFTAVVASNVSFGLLLLKMCPHFIKVDIYDGDEGPMIYHGNTLTSRVSLLDICQAINKYAFMTSPYPLLISAEIHCGIEQQDQLVDIMNDVFGDSLVQAPIEGRPKIKVLPSPEDLKNKFLLKVQEFISSITYLLTPLPQGKKSIRCRSTRGGSSAKVC